MTSAEGGIRRNKGEIYKEKKIVYLTATRTLIQVAAFSRLPD